MNVYTAMIDDSSGSTLSHKKSDFIFGVRKRRKVHSVPLAFSSSYHGYLSSSKIRRSAEVGRKLMYSIQTSVDVCVL